MRAVKAAQPRCDDLLCRHAQSVYAQRSRGASRRGDRLGNRSVHFQDHRRDAPVKTRPRRRRRDASCRAIEQLHAKPRFEMANGLAQGGRRQPEMIRRAREACRLDDGGKGLQLSKVRPAHYASLSK